MLQSNHDVSRYAAALIPIALVALVALGLAACNDAEPGPGPGDESALARLTAAAEQPAVDSVETGPTPLGTSDGGETNTEAAMEGPAEATMPPQEGDGPDGPAPDMTQYFATLTAVPEEVGFAPVGELVKTQVPLATFTPDPRTPRLEGELVYVRGGRLRVGSAAGESSGPIEHDAEMPAVWSPPEDPGRGWMSPDGEWIAVLAGADATMWVTRPDGSGTKPVSGPLLPTNMHIISASTGGEQEIRLLPDSDYTLVLTPGRDSTFAVLADDNSRHVRGQGRLRVVHAAAVHGGEELRVAVNGTAIGGPVSYGSATGDQAVYSGPVQLDIGTAEGRQLVSLPQFELLDKELVTVFLYGAEKMLGARAKYEPGTQPTSGTSRVRVFNAGDEPLTVEVDGGPTLAQDLTVGQLGSYVEVPAVASDDETRDFQQIIYGLRSGEEPVAWSPDSRRIAFVGTSDGLVDLYVTDVEGQLERVTNDDRMDANPVWAPDSETVAWISADQSYQSHALRFRTGDGSLGEVDSAGIRAAVGWADTAAVLFPQGLGWLDDDVLYCYPRSAKVSGGIWTFDISSGALEQVYELPMDYPDFSEEAGAWVFNDQAGEGKVYRYRPGSSPTELVSANGYYPKWSPDGMLVSYSEGEPTSPNGWRVHVLGADGSDDRALTDWLPLLQTEPPVPGPNAKRFWLADGDVLGFTRAGTDYGRAEEAGPMAGVEAGDDIENLWVVPVDASEDPKQVTDLTRVFYMKEVAESPESGTLGVVAFSYLDRSMQLWTVPADGGKPVHIDGPVRWYEWLGD